MELVKRNIHMNRLKSHTITQITLEDDFNVPDTKDDIYKIITKDSMITSSLAKIQDGKVLFSGSLLFKFLYNSSSDGGPITNMNGNIPFTETINCENANDHDGITVKWEIDDLNIGIINSRKISVRALVTLSVSCEEIYDFETAVRPENSDSENIYCLEKNAEVAKLAVCKKDILRVKENIDLTSGKPNISQILWDNVCLKSVNTKVLDNAISVNGELSIFVLYTTDDENIPIQWFESSVPFDESLNMPGCTDDMIGDIQVSIGSCSLSVKPDFDGELRSLEPDIVLDLDIKIYSEEQLDFMVDAYSPDCLVTPTYNDITYNSILTKNLSKCKLSDKLKLDISNNQIMQLLCANGNAKIDDISVEDNGLSIEGVVVIKLMYISSDDKNPISMVDEVIPFTHTIEANGVTEKCLTFIKPSIEQLSATMTGSSEIEVRASVLLDCLILNNNQLSIITDISCEDYDAATLQARPGMVAYLTKPGDTLWDIAKEFHSTTNRISDINDLKSDILQPGEMLLIC